MEGIAIIGISGRFPGARNVADFWQNLRRGVESISHFKVEELEVRDAERLTRDPSYVKARSVLDDVDLFDPGFFGIYPQEAKLIDPQHRVFLECCWEALEDAGYDPAADSSWTGVFAGCSPNSYFLRQVAGGRAYLDEYTSAYQVGFYPAMLGAIADTLATRVAFKLNLKGPALTLQTACSTSLVAVCEASKSLLFYECDKALAGGVSITFPQKRGYLHQSGGMVSPDGHCRAFDADAQGTVFGSGAGVVVLKRLNEAVRDGDHIYAVIRGTAVNNDGSGKVGFAAPSVEGQARVIAVAQAVAGVEASTISYVEAHGTGTPVGDPIELAALTKVFRANTDATAFCAIGTAKANIGHLDVASGVTGLIKTALALEHREIPPQINFTRSNPQLQLETSPFYVNVVLSPWTARGDHPLRAGVSSFGVGGTNAHVVLEGAPDMLRSGSHRSCQVLSISAKSPEALQSASVRLADHLAGHPENLADAAYTLHVGRRPFAYRRSVVSRTLEDAVTALRNQGGRPASSCEGSPRVCFMFPGQGSQYVRMGQELYETESVFRKTLDDSSEVLLPLIGEDLRAALYRIEDEAEASKRLNETALAQPALFSIEYALAKLWMSWGIEPAGMVGHSIGEFVAACLAGVFSLEDGVKLVATRGRLMQDLPGGAMLSVRLPESEVDALLHDGLSIAALNSPTLSVVSGPNDSIAELERSLAASGVVTRRLHTSHAFHSAMMDPIIGPFQDSIRGVRLNAPAIPYVSCVSGTWITPEQATDPAYWATHFRQPVRFSEAVRVLRAESNNILVEVGPGSTLQTLARQHAGPEGAGQVVVSSLPDPGESESAVKAVYEALGQVWNAGGAVDWRQFYASEKRMRVSLPSYPFERKSYWSEPGESADIGPESTPEPTRARQDVSESTASGGIPEEIAVNLSRKGRIVAELVRIFEEVSGLEAPQIAPTATFLELGFDSLFLTQISQALQGGFGLKITFRQLLNQLSSVDALASYLEAELPKEQFAEPTEQAVTAPARAVPSPGGDLNLTGADLASVEKIFHEQLQAMTQIVDRQLQVLRGLGGAIPAVVAQPDAQPARPPSDAESPKPNREFNAFGPYKPVQTGPTGGLTARQQAHLDELIERYTRRTAGSKALTQKYRKVLADPRVASGFRLQWKEMVYPIVVNRSRGSRLWDVDGNEYIDLLNGFGPTAFGHLPDFVTEALQKQLSEGIEIGPQTALAGEVAELISELTGVERVTFCNTGSEAVMAGVRVARTVTGRKKIALFAGSYHGTFDEVLVKRIGRIEALRSGPIAPGIPQEKVQNVIVLDYGAPESLEIIRKQAGELAAVLVEPVQSRHPDLQPRDFLKELRKITAESGVALLIDEIVTGFRAHPGGVQALFDVQADLVTYGKVLGGGMPIGVLAGRAAFMDALDGGMWQYGDESFPETGVTFFAGTFVRHPLALAAAKSVLQHLKTGGPQLQEGLTQKTASLVAQLNRLFETHQLPARIETFGSVFYFSFPSDYRFGSLLYYLLRERGIHIQEGFPCFLTTAHNDADIQQIVKTFEESVAELKAGDMLPGGDQARVEAVSEVALTEAQLEIWLSAQLSPEASCSYNEAFTLDLRGDLELPVLRDAIQAVIDRHDALRTTFDAEGKFVRFAKHMPIDMPLIDFSGEGDPQAEFDRLIDLDARTPFDLVTGPLLRIRVIKLEPQRHAVLVTSHHIVCDGWSTNVILDEVAKLYSSRRRGSQPRLDPVLPFEVYARRQQETVALKDRVDAETYWLARFADHPPVLELPTDHPRPAVKGFEGATRRRKIGRSLYQGLKKAGARQGATLFATLLTGFEALLARPTGQDDLVVGIPAAAQSLEEGTALVGHCVNFLPLRARIAESDSFAQLLAKNMGELLDAYEHQTYTYGTLVRKLGIPRDPSRLPLIEVQFNLERVGANLDFEGLIAGMDACPKRFVNFDLFLNIVESEDGLVMDCDYNTALFDDATLDRWLGHYETILAAATESMAQPVGRLPLLSKGERDGLLVDRNQTSASYPDCCVHELFEEQAARNPNTTALVFGRHTLSYGDLNAKAGQLASFLIKQGIGSKQLVAICVDRSAEMVIAILGVLKAGGTYVPLDPAYSPERLNFILAETEVKVVLTQEHIAVGLAEIKARVICLDSEWALIGSEEALDSPAPVRPDDSAYVIYTSGSTGTPKGVEISHRSVVNFLASMQRRPGIIPNDRLLAVTTLSFDIAGLEIFLPLISGACVVIADRDVTMDGARLSNLIHEAGITMLQATPSTWRLLLEAGWKPQPSFKMLCGGEALSRELGDQLLATEGVLWNMYGPTETTIWSAVSLVNEGPSPVRIGPPIANTQFYVLDRYQQPIPLGVPGELYIGGDGLACGYFRRPELTSEKFVADPFRGGQRRLYRTGDLVRMLPDGTLEFLGRLDNQVKIRGFRIELGEIETVLMRQLGIKEAVAIAHGDAAAKKLVAYVATGDGRDCERESLRNALGAVLPAYMIPAAFVPLPTIPRTPNGKVDRRALPEPSLSVTARLKRTPRNQAETVLNAIFSEVLRLEDLSIDDNLFELGADSIQLFQIVARANRAGLGVTVLQILHHPTIESLSSVTMTPGPEPRGPAMERIQPVTRERYRVRNR